MGNVQLVKLDPALEETLVGDPGCREALVKDDWPRVAELVHQLIGRTLVADPVSIDELQWGEYYGVDEGTHEVIGSCAFKASPTETGMVEIAYFTYPGFEGRGYATQMARKLINLASGSTAVQEIVAHTLPEANTSTRVLEKVGMNFVGEVTDPEDGRVWRWHILAET